MPTIHILNGPEKGQSYNLINETIDIGRSPENDINMADRSISRKHLRIHREGNAYFIRDLQSTNGTYVNDQQITPGKEVKVEEGIPIAVGNIFFTINKPYSGDIQAIRDSIDYSEDLNEKAEVYKKDRPLTAIRNMELIQKVSKVLMESLDINEILENVLDAIFDLLERIDRGIIILLDSETGKIKDIITSDKQSSEDTIMLYSRTIVNRVLQEGKPVIMSDTFNEDEAERSDSMEVMKIRSVMCVPLISRSKIRGVIYVDSINRPFGFRKDDLSLLTTLSSPAAVAIENALLHSTIEKIDGDKTKAF